MGINEQELQDLVDRMAVPAADGYACRFWLDHTKAKEFLAMIKGYIRKSAYKSDIYDPEDAEAEVVLEVWRAFQKYGPRPSGQPFHTLLKLKTNNVLTNRARKRFSKKSKLNYICESLESLTMDPENCSGRGRVYKGSSHNIYDLCCDEKPKEKSYGDRRSTVYNTSSETKQGEIEMQNATAIIRADESEVGKTYLTVKDKIVTVVDVRSTGEEDDGVTLLIPLTGKEVDVPLHYVLIPYSGEDEDPVEEDPVEEDPVEEDPVEEEQTMDSSAGAQGTDRIVESAAEEHVESSQESPLVISAAEIEAEMAAEKMEEEPKKKPPKKKETRNMGKVTVKKESAKALIINMLRAGPQTRETLAEAIAKERKESGSNKVTDIDKLKNYASVIVSNLNRDDAYSLEKTSEGWILK